MPSSANKSKYTCRLCSADYRAGLTGQSRQLGQKQVGSKQVKTPGNRIKLGVLMSFVR